MDKEHALAFQKLNDRIAELEKRAIAAETRAAEAEQYAKEAHVLVERASALLVEHVATLDTRINEAADIIVSRVTKQIPHLMIG